MAGGEPRFGTVATYMRRLEAHHPPLSSEKARLLCLHYRPDSIQFKLLPSRSGKVRSKKTRSRSAEMPLDCLEFVENPLLEKLGKVERLLATEQQWCKGKLRDVDGRRRLVGVIEAADAQHQLPRLILRATREVTGKRYCPSSTVNGLLRPATR